MVVKGLFALIEICISVWGFYILSLTGRDVRKDTENRSKDSETYSEEGQL